MLKEYLCLDLPLFLVTTRTVPSQLHHVSTMREVQFTQRMCITNHIVWIHVHVSSHHLVHPLYQQQQNIFLDMLT